MKLEKRFLSEIIISIILVGLLVLLFNPTHLLMPTSVQMMLVVFLVVLFLAFFSFIWREKTSDERESLHRNLAGRFAYLTGTGVLVLGVIIQSLNHEIDIWLVIALITIVLSKVIGLLYSQFKY